MVGHQLFHGGIGDGFDAAAGVGRQLVNEMAGQEGNVLLARAQGRDVDGHDVEAVVEVFAEGALLEGGAQVLVGGGDDADVDVAGDVAAEAFEFALLQDAQQLDLDGGGDVADLVEEDGAGVGLLELAGLGGLAPVKAPFS